MRVSWQNLKGHAKERGIYFDLTLDQFKEFCYETDYMSKKGITSTCYTVDRIKSDPSIGYTAGNIQAMEKGDNSRKGNRDFKYKDYNYITGTAKVITVHNQPQAADLPF